MDEFLVFYCIGMFVAVYVILICFDKPRKAKGQRSQVSWRHLRHRYLK